MCRPPLHLYGHFYYPGIPCRILEIIAFISHVCGVATILIMKKIATGKGAGGLPFVKNTGYPQNGFFPDGDPALDLQTELKIHDMTDKMNKGRDLCLAITLPESLAGLPVRVEVDPDSRDIAVRIAPEKEVNRKYAFVWNGQCNLKVAFSDILWVEASGSYSTLHLRGGRSMTVSFNLSCVEGRLPPDDFVRIHRSFIVNMMHVRSLTGNCVEVGGRDITIGRGYRKGFLGRFSFIGSRDNGTEKAEKEGCGRRP